ncbi:MAG: cytidine deaminase [Clostridiales bacterium]|nr:cytidine deaminase [Clostridiales bacterium]
MYEELIRLAKEARRRAYAPYSGFSVGAALLTADGKIYTGCNVEAPSFLACCAERNALYRAVFDGHRKFEALAVAGGKTGDDITDICPPCGICRQALNEFCDPDFKIIMVNSDGYVIKTLGELLPLSFKE